MSCNAANHNALLAELCFGTMTKKLHFNIGDIQSSYHLDSEDPELKQRVEQNITADLQYACQHWAQHMEQAESINTDNFHNSINNLFPIQVFFWIEAMNLLSLSDKCIWILQKAHKWVLEVRISGLKINYD